MAVISQRESGWWQARIRRQGWPSQSKTLPTKTEAEVWARQIEAGFDRGVMVSTGMAEKTTLANIAAKFAENFAPYHYRGPAWSIKLAHLVRHLGQYSLAAITAQCVASYRDARQSEPDGRYKDSKKAPRVSGATVKSELDVLSKVLDVAQKEFSIILPTGNPVHSIRKPAGAQARDYRLSSYEWNALLDKCRMSKNLWLVHAVGLAVETGMRQGELRGLLWKDVDLSRQVAILKVKPGASKLGQVRAVPLSRAAILILETMPKSLCGRVIPIARQSLYGAFKTAVVRAGVPMYRFHDIRHESLSRLAERGDMTVLEMAAVSGHKTLQTLNRYIHLQAERLALKLG